MALIASKIALPDAREGLARERLLRTLEGTAPLALVIGPAGAGKSTLLAQAAKRSPSPVAWFRAEQEDRSAEAVLAYLQRAIGAALGTAWKHWDDVHAAAAALHGPSRKGLLVMIDDLHTLHDSEGERAVGRLIDYLPRGVRVIAASRVEPGAGINLPRLRVSGDVAEVATDDLRFRTWEVEQLFRDVYDEPLPPEDLAALARRTQGWAAALKLFHLATTGKPTQDRRRMVACLTVPSRLVREYLATNVVAELPFELRLFLLDTCVLGHLTSALCDAMRGVAGSAAMLAELARRQLLSCGTSDDGTYRCHDVLRSHLHAVALEEWGEQELQRRFLRAGALLAHDGMLGDAAVAYCCGQSWDVARRLLDAGADKAVGARCLDVLERSAPGGDPWMHLLLARRALAEGRVTQAREAYRRAEQSTGASSVADIARRERGALTSWTESGVQAPTGWIAYVQAAARGDRSEVPLPEDELERRLAQGFSALLRGDVSTAAALLSSAAEEADGAVAAGAQLAVDVTALLSGDDPRGEALEETADACEQQQLPWLAQVGRAALALGRPGHLEEAAGVRRHCVRLGDELGAAVTGLIEGLAGDLHGQPRPERLSEAAAAFRDAGLGGLEVWALAALHGPVLRGRASAVHSLARATGTSAVLDLVGRLRSDRMRVGQRGVQPADEVASPGGAAAPAVQASVAVDPRVPTLRVLGGFRLSFGGRALDTTAVKPRARAVLHLLGAHGGRPVHRDAIVDALWPARDPQAALRALHVSLSAVRRQLEVVSPEDPAHLLAREGSTYVLAPVQHSDIDVVRFGQERDAGVAATRAGDADAAIGALTRALAWYRGDLLPEAGAEEWIVERRDRLRLAAADVAEQLATLLLQRDAVNETVAACERGLEVDGYQDGLWRTLIAAHDRRGDLASAARARAGYDGVLRELGVTSG